MSKVLWRDRLGTGRSGLRLAAVAGVCAGLWSYGATSSADAHASASRAKSPIVITSITAVNTAVFSGPQIFSGAKGAARAINKQGGIDGHKIIVHTCNTEADPNVEVTCARQAVSDGSIATVGNLVFENPDGVEETLNAGGVTDINALAQSPKELTLPNAFPIANQNTAQSACFNPAFTKAVGAKKATTLLIGLGASETISALMKQEANGQHNPIPLEPSIGFPVSTSDFTPVITQIENEGVNLLSLETNPSTTAAAQTTAASLGQKFIWCGNFGTLNGKTELSLGSKATGAYFVSPFPPLTAAKRFPILKQFTSDMKAETASGDSSASTSVSNYTALMFNSWLGVEILRQAAENIHGAITRKSFRAAMNHLHPNLGGIATVNYAKHRWSGAYARVFDPNVYLWHWNTAKRNWYLTPYKTDTMKGF